MRVLESTEQLKALDAGFNTLAEQLEAKEGKAGLETVTELHKAVGSIAGADKVKDRLNKVRRQLRKKKHVKRAVKEFNKALREQVPARLARKSGWQRTSWSKDLPGCNARYDRYSDAAENEPRTIALRCRLYCRPPRYLT